MSDLKIILALVFIFSISINMQGQEVKRGAVETAEIKPNKNRKVEFATSHRCSN